MEDCRGNYITDVLEQFKKELGEGMKDCDKGLVERFEKFVENRRLRTAKVLSEKKSQGNSYSSKAVEFCLGIHKIFLKKRMKTIRYSFLFMLSLFKKHKKNMKKYNDELNGIENKSYKEKALKPAYKYNKDSLRESIEKSLNIYIKNKRPAIFAMFLRSMIKSSISSVYYKIIQFHLNINILIIPTPSAPKPLQVLEIKKISLCHSLFNILNSRLLLTKSGAYYKLINQRPLHLNISIVPREPKINLALTINPIIKPLQSEIIMINQRISIESTALRLKKILLHLSRSIIASGYFKILNPNPLSIEVRINPYKLQVKNFKYKAAANLMRSFLKSAVKSLETAVLFKIAYVSIIVNVSINTKSKDSKQAAINNFYNIFCELIKKSKRVVLVKVIYCPPPLINLQITYKTLFCGSGSSQKDVPSKKSAFKPTILAEIVEDDDEIKHKKDSIKKIYKKPKILFRATRGDVQKLENFKKLLFKYKKFAFEVLKSYFDASLIKKKSRLLKKMLANLEKLIFITKYINFSIIRDTFFFTYNKLQHFSSVLSEFLLSYRSKFLKKSFFRYRFSVYGPHAMLFFSLSKAQIHSSLRSSMQTMVNYIIARNNYFFDRDTTMHRLLCKIYFKRISYTLILWKAYSDYTAISEALDFKSSTRKNRKETFEFSRKNKINTYNTNFLQDLKRVSFQNFKFA